MQLQPFFIEYSVQFNNIISLVKHLRHIFKSQNITLTTVVLENNRVFFLNLELLIGAQTAPFLFLILNMTFSEIKNNG